MGFKEFTPYSVAISLTLTNYLLKSSTVTVSVYPDYAEKALPSVLISSPTYKVFSTWQQLNVFAHVNPSRCGNLSSSPMLFEWSVFEGSVLSSSIANQGKDPRFLRLNPHTLIPGMTYTLFVQVTVVTSTKSVVTTDARRVLLVGRSGVKAKISGGSTITTMQSDAFVLDGSSSYAIDNPGAGSLSFYWNCVMISPNFGQQCNIPSSTNMRWVIEQYSMDAGTYQITLTVTDEYQYGDQARVELRIAEDSVPRLQIQPLMPKYNSADKIIIAATVDGSDYSVHAHWSSSSSYGLEMSNIALTPLERVFSSGLSIYQLAIAANSLVAGSTYVFQLQGQYVTASGNNAPSAYTTVTISINKPPSGGLFYVSPTEGSALVTSFLFQTSLWTDDLEDLPLAYIFSYYTSSASNQVVVKTADTASYCSGFLGQGLKQLKFKVTALVTAVDIYGGSSVKETSVRVSSVSGGPSVVALLALDGLTRGFSRQDPNAVTQVLGAALSVINTVDCTVPVACASINRDVCSSTANTCGACLPGHIGALGDSNLPCQLQCNIYSAK